MEEEAKSMIELDGVYAPSEDIVAREIEGEIVIIPLVSGIADTDDELYTLNETGKAIWDRLDGNTSLGDVAAALAGEYEAVGNDIEEDVLGLVEELARRRMLVEVPRA